MENDVDLLPMIRDEFQQGSNEAQAFMNICQKLEMDLPLHSSVSNWIAHFHAFDFPEDGMDGFTEANRDRLLAILVHYSKFNYALFSRKEKILDYKNGQIIQSRFKMAGDGPTNSFAIFDTFNEGLKTLETSITHLKLNQLFFPTLIAHDRLLLNVFRNGVEYLLLLDAGFDELKCSVLDEVTLNITCLQIILDSTDKSRCLLRAGVHEEPTSIYKGYIAGDRIHLFRQKFLFEVKLVCCKLVKDRLFAFQYQEGEDDWLYTEYDLSLNSPRKVNQWICYKVPKIMHFFEDSLEYVWSSNKLYAALNARECFLIYVFDLDTRTWTSTKFIGAGHVDKMEVNYEEDLLTISAIEGLDEPVKINTIYRLPMRKPDKLRYIVWANIRRQAIFFESKLYNKLISNLPYTSEFREFSPNY